MSRSKPPPGRDDPREPSFAELAESLGGVRRLPQSDQAEDPPRFGPAGAPRRSMSARRVRFVFPVDGQPLLGHAPGFRTRDLHRVQSGEHRPERRIDLHQLTRDEARRRLHATLVDAAESGCLCVLVIHGRGLRSPDGRPVLKALLPEWLSESPAGPLVRAFAPAAAKDGGPGATYVWLGG